MLTILCPVTGSKPLLNAEFSADRRSGLISPAIRCLCPNRDARPAGAEPELVVLHGISLPPGEFGGSAIIDLFGNTLDWDAHPYYQEIRGVRVSAHVLIRRDGELIQFVPFTERAWHAGASRFRARECCNDFSIGIELEGSDDVPYADAQYAVLSGVLLALFACYPGLSARRIAAHSDIAPGRKTDPGPAFDWLRLYDGLGGGASAKGVRRLQPERADIL
jgi:AmpD protein